MEPFFARPAFSVGDHTFTWGDVHVAAVLWGGWDAQRRETREALAALAAAESEGAAPADEAVSAAAREFRYARDLVSGDEMRRWLERHGLSVDDWMSHVRRRLARDRRAAPDGPGAAARDAVDEETVERCAVVDGSCLGLYARTREALAGHAALAGDDRPDDPALAAVLERFPRWLAERGSAGIPPAECRESMRRVAAVEAGYERARAAHVTPAAVADAIVAHRFDWVRLGCRVVAFPGEQAAREAVLCVREDGETLAEVAADAHVPLQERRFYLGDLRPALLRHFIGAAAGDVVGPLAEGGEHVLFEVVERALPDASDAELRERAERAILDRVTARAVRERARLA